MLRERPTRFGRSFRREHQIAVAGRAQRRELPHLRSRRRGTQHGHRRPLPQRCTHGEQRQQLRHRVQRSELEDQPIEMPADLQRQRRQNADPPQHRDLHAARPSRLVARAQHGALGRFRRLRQPQRLLLQGEGPLPLRQGGRAQLFQRVERSQVIAVALAQMFDQRQLAAAAIARVRGTHRVPAIEAGEQHRLTEKSRLRRRVSGRAAPFQRRRTTHRRWRSVRCPTSIRLAGRHGDVHPDHPGQLVRLRHRLLHAGGETLRRRGCRQVAFFRYAGSAGFRRWRQRHPGGRLPGRLPRGIGVNNGNENRLASRRFRLPLLSRLEQREMPRPGKGDLAGHECSGPPALRPSDRQSRPPPGSADLAHLGGWPAGC